MVSRMLSSPTLVRSSFLLTGIMMEDYLLKMSRIDTIARLGDQISHTTFPKLVDEADLNGLEKVWLVNA